MLRIYLDQAKWIDLTKCRVGKADGARYKDVLDLSREAVARGQVSFVLSCAHYYETQRRAQGPSRRDVGETMTELSKFHAIAPVHKIVPAEIQDRLTGEPVRSQINVFGVGFKHAFGTDMDVVAGFKVTNEESLPFEVRAQLKLRLRDEVEKCLLAAPEDVPEAARVMLETATRIAESAQSFADGQTKLGAMIDDQKLRGRLDDVVVATEIADILDPLLDECARNGVHVDDLIADKEETRALLRALPSRWVMSRLRLERLRNRQQPWKANDFNDLMFLSTSVPYCDVVVTERQWSTHVNKLGLSQEYDTIVLHDLTDLTGVIAEASRVD